jgi:hypothetical protein
MLHIELHKGNIHDTITRCEAIEDAIKYPSAKTFCARDKLSKAIEIAKGIKNKFIVTIKKWILERIFSWMN